ncbi:hypothetical protein, partial [Cellulomonas septica]
MPAGPARPSSRAVASAAWTDDVPLPDEPPFDPSYDEPPIDAAYDEPPFDPAYDAAPPDRPSRGGG